MNPKHEGSNLIDCIPQVGQCPIGCNECFYNDDRFYRTKDAPLVPSLEEAEGKIVRVNSGHDSNLQVELVLEKTKQYKDKFYNTSIPKFGVLPGPIVYTCNPMEDHHYTIIFSKKSLRKLMFVRVRMNTWDKEQLAYVFHLYRAGGVEVVITPMRYRKHSTIPPGHRKYYEYGKHTANAWWKLNDLGWDTLYNFCPPHIYKYCGSKSSSLCKDCGNCEELYKKWTSGSRAEKGSNGPTTRRLD